jgi:hypothetical protein
MGLVRSGEGVGSIENFLSVSSTMVVVAQDIFLLVGVESGRGTDWYLRS